MCKRCLWLDESKPDYVAYHDQEWGVPIWDDRKLFEFITLESAQAGLSWYTILKKRENYRTAFKEFDVQKVANISEQDVDILMENKGIIRNRAKILATINNAQRFIEVQSAFGSFAKYQWAFMDFIPKINDIKSKDDYPTTSEISEKFSKDLKKRGFKFLGPTTIYAHMQACGMVNDHDNDCHRKQPLTDLIASLDLTKELNKETN
ncbi:DNA-3-methyladenine glycosylase I [Pseudoalteromonas umbrosa]|uniref:DNA-3-methyladenine glycosylase I n=1 Tax=Pseudoalteromonas umbrosa TaxID=3048489 RepID=UPI0024C45AC8|nr:DNA-3-methyladenine glycosylase I [Pseudoalteromonas sp. B95]MDK1285637.1 DNA-3-methyladenine glycosylase I [Pseudoalteromonas sp. B95]